jgi:hypothetical protein
MHGKTTIKLILLHVVSHEVQIEFNDQALEAVLSDDFEHNVRLHELVPYSWRSF